MRCHCAEALPPPTPSKEVSGEEAEVDVGEEAEVGVGEEAEVDVGEEAEVDVGEEAETDAEGGVIAARSVGAMAKMSV